MPYHRYFTDIDIYVGDEFDKAEKVLLELGYEKLVDTDHNDVSYVKKPSLHIELHKELFPDDYTFEGYFDEPYKRTSIKEGYKYYHIFNDDDFFIHVLCHLYKHFTFGGCGLKMFLDIYVMLKKMPLNMDYIRYRRYLQDDIAGLFDAVHRIHFVVAFNNPVYPCPAS